MDHKKQRGLKILSTPRSKSYQLIKPSEDTETKTGSKRIQKFQASCDDFKQDEQRRKSVGYRSMSEKSTDINMVSNLDAKGDGDFSLTEAKSVLERSEKVLKRTKGILSKSGNVKLSEAIKETKCHTKTIPETLSFTKDIKEDKLIQTSSIIKDSGSSSIVQTTETLSNTQPLSPKKHLRKSVFYDQEMGLFRDASIEDLVDKYAPLPEPRSKRRSKPPGLTLALSAVVAGTRPCSSPTYAKTNNTCDIVPQNQNFVEKLSDNNEKLEENIKQKAHLRNINHVMQVETPTKSCTHSSGELHLTESEIPSLSEELHQTDSETQPKKKKVPTATLR